jgi:uncharacterized membrane protein
MRTLARWLILVSLAVWIGGITFFSFVVAPQAFSHLPSDQAARIVRISLAALHYTGMACAIVILLATVGARLRRATPLRCALGLMLLSTAISQFGVTPQMDRIRASVGGSIQALPAQDAGRAAFDRLHQLSVALEGIVLLAALGALAVYAAENDS